MLIGVLVQQVELYFNSKIWTIILLKTIFGDFSYFLLYNKFLLLFKYFYIAIYMVLKS